MEEHEQQALPSETLVEMRNAKEDQLAELQRLKDQMESQIEQLKSDVWEINGELYNRGEMELPIDIDDLDDPSPKDLVREIEKQSDDGAPEDIVIQCFNKFGYDKDSLDRLKNVGKVYEPRKGTFRTT